MEDRVIKEALSYSLGSDLHEGWRSRRPKLADGTYEPRVKTTTDEAWILEHGTDQVDIGNTTFDKLPLDKQYENFEAARVVIELVYDKTIAGEPISEEEKEEMGAVIHEAWVQRNPWEKPELLVPYANLEREEQLKDIAQIEPAQAKIRAFMRGEIDIESLCEQYGIEGSQKRM